MYEHMFVQFKRAIRTALQDIVRHKSISLSSIAVMSLVFLVLSIFGVFAYGAMKFLNYVETREHLEVFFNTEVPEAQIIEIKQTLENTQKTAYVNYTTQEQAAEFLREKHSDNELILGAITPEALPASLAIRAKKIDYVSELNTIIESQDHEDTLIYKISYNEDTTNLLKDLLFWIRLIGILILVFVIAVVFLVSLITVEIGITMRQDEISIMRLVGGSKLFIRAPFIVQGALYGIFGALIASICLITLWVIFHFLKDQSPTLSFLTSFFSDLDWPQINALLALKIVGAEVVLGALIGMINSTLAVIRQLK